MQCRVWYPPGYNGRKLEEEIEDNGKDGEGSYYENVDAPIQPYILLIMKGT